jgi:hypothetical protein
VTLAEQYATEISPEFISSVTDEVMAEVTAWQSRPLEPMYPVVFFDALRVKSFLRTFAEWLGKSGMVREPAFYVGAESPHAHHQIATVDQSWSTHGVDIEATIQKVAQVDSWVGLQLELRHRFGLRPK